MQFYMAVTAFLVQRVQRLRADNSRECIGRETNSVTIPQQTGVHEPDWRWLVAMVYSSRKDGRLPERARGEAVLSQYRSRTGPLTRLSAKTCRNLTRP